METIREIVSFSHGGYGAMWYPFSARLRENHTAISAESYYEIQDLLRLLKLMFITTNHHPDLVNKENRELANKYLLGSTKKSLCSVRFRTEKNEYVLTRCFVEQYSTEATLQKVDSSVIFRGHDVIQMLSKFHKPIIIDSTSMQATKSLIFKPINDYSRTCMMALANGWAKMVGITNSRIHLNQDGRWSTSGELDFFSKRRSIARTAAASPLRLITNLVQAVMKKRSYNLCTPVFSQFNMEGLNQFEAITVMDLVNCVSREEGIQFIVGINTSSDTNSMIDAIETPRLSIYGI
jgi:hypothetical protein